MEIADGELAGGFYLRLGAVFLNEVMELEPCVLFWYQRIAMFPLVLILGAGAYTQDASSVKYAMPLALAGWLAAFYHSLLYVGFIPAAMTRKAA